MSLSWGEKDGADFIRYRYFCEVENNSATVKPLNLCNHAVYVRTAAPTYVAQNNLI